MDKIDDSITIGKLKLNIGTSGGGSSFSKPNVNPKIHPFDLLVYVPCHQNSIGGANVPGNLERVSINL